MGSTLELGLKGGGIGGISVDGVVVVIFGSNLFTHEQIQGFEQITLL